MAIDLADDKRGNAAIEFALVAPVFVAILMGTIQFGLLFYAQAEMGHVARNVSRLLSVAEMNSNEAEAYAAAHLPNWGDAEYTTSVVSTADVFTVTISIPTDSLTFFPFFQNDVLGPTLSASVSMRAEEV